MATPEKPKPPLHRRIIAVRWAVPVVIVGLAALLQVVVLLLLPNASVGLRTTVAILLFGIVGSVVAWFAIDWLAANVARQEQTQRELRQAYERLGETHRQLLAVHDIGKEIASASDMQKVLELAARAPTHLANAVGSAVVTFDPDQERLKLEMAWGLSDAYVGRLRRRVDAGIPSDRCQSCQGLTAHVSGDCPLFDGLQDVARAEGIHSLACLPLSRDRTREGVITAYFPSPAGPPEEQVQLLNIVATEIASALDAIRLRNEQMSAIYALEHLTRNEQDLGELLGQVLATSLAGWGVQRGAILLYDEQDVAWHCWQQRGLGDHPDHPHFGLVLRLAEQARLAGGPLMIADLADYPDCHDLGSAGADLLLSGGDVLGALVLVADHPGRFTEPQAPFLSAIAHQAALAIHNAQLNLQVQQMAVLEERYRLSREMHDGLAQSLGVLGWQLDHLKTLLDQGKAREVAEVLAGARQMTREAYMDVREAIDGLRLAVDHPGGLRAALAAYVADFGDRTGIETDFMADERDCPLSAEAELQLLRIVQEALTNVRKHAVARRAWVRLHCRENTLELTIADDGRGFDPSLPRGRHHLGLAGMRERVHGLGGSFTLATSPGQGTRVTVTVPVKVAVS